MGQPGWISMRNVPRSKVKEYHAILTEFFVNKKICPLCKGTGYEVDKKKKVSDKMVKYGGIKPLEDLHEAKLKLKGKLDVQMADVIREILSYSLEGRKSCKKCDGFRFVKRKAAKAA